MHIDSKGFSQFQALLDVLYFIPDVKVLPLSCKVLHTLFLKSVCAVRLKVKKNLVSVVAHRSLTPDLWDVTLEKSQDSSHDVVSIICRERGIHKHPHKYIIFFRLLFYVQLFILLSDLC